MNNQQIILNFLMLSVPEEFVMASIILILLKRFDYFNKENFSYNILKIFFIFVLPIAVISNLSLFKIKMASNVNILINIALMIISVLILNKQSNCFI